MKKKLRYLSVITVLSYNACYGMSAETEEFMKDRASSFQYVYYFYAGHSCHSYTTMLPEIVKEHTKSLNNYFDSLLARGDFVEAFSLGEKYKKHPKYAHSPTGGFPNRVDMDQTAVDEALTNFKAHLEGYSMVFFKKIVADKKFDEARRFIEVYRAKEEGLADDWLRQVQAAVQREELRQEDLQRTERELRDEKVRIGALSLQLQRQQEDVAELQRQLAERDLEIKELRAQAAARQEADEQRNRNRTPKRERRVHVEEPAGAQAQPGPQRRAQSPGARRAQSPGRRAGFITADGIKANVAQEL